MATFNETADEHQLLDENNPTTNLQSNYYEYNDSGGKGGTKRARTIHEWDISALIGATINSAKIVLSAVSAANPDDFAIHFFKMLRGDWLPAQTTWLIYKTGSNWTAPGCDSLNNDYDNAQPPYDLTSDIAYFTVVSPWEIHFTGCEGLVEDALDNESGILRVVSRCYAFKSGEMNYGSCQGPALLLIDYTPAAGGAPRARAYILG